MSVQDDAYQFLIAGQNAFNRGKLNQARQLFKKSLDKGHIFDAAFLIALTYGQQKNVKMAANYFRRATQIDPTVAEGYFNLGYALQQLKDFLGARDSYISAIKIRTDYHEALHNLGVVYEELGEFDLAIQRLNDALQVRPDAAESLFNKGSVLIKMGDQKAALESLDAALNFDQNHVKALNNRGLIYVGEKRFREALEDFSKAAILEPEDQDYQFNKAQAALNLKALAIAADAFSETIRLNPDHADAWRNRAFMLEQLKRNDEATYCFERFLKLRPDASYAYGYLHSSRMHLCDWHYFEKDSSTILQHIDKNEPVITPHGLFLLSSTRAQQKKAAEMWCADQFKNFISTSFPIDRKGNERIRIAYFSSDFHSHPVGILTARLFELHDREKFEVYAFSSGIPSRDPVRMRIEGGVDHFINVREMSDFEMVDLARAENIDIAIDMTGYTADNRAAAFALRLAPIQVNYLGYSGTMGAAFMDYIIGDPVLIPPDHENDYSEKIARLPDCYMPSDPTREVSERSMTRSEFGLPEDGFIFCAFNNPYKITPPQFDLWMQILKSVPKSVLWLSPTSQKAMENLCHEARKRGVEPSRLVFSKRMNQLSEHLARQQLADLFLDTLPHNAHATSNDALWAGLPILTRLGEGFAGRVAGSLLTAVGMPDMIMPNSQSYVARAIEIATTPGLSAKLKARLAENKKKMPLFDAEKYTRNLEKAYSHMQQAYLHGLAAKSFNVV